MNQIGELLEQPPKTGEKGIEGFDLLELSEIKYNDPPSINEELKFNDQGILLNISEKAPKRAIPSHQNLSFNISLLQNDKEINKKCFALTTSKTPITQRQKFEPLPEIKFKQMAQPRAAQEAKNRKLLVRIGGKKVMLVKKEQKANQSLSLFNSQQEGIESQKASIRKLKERKIVLRRRPEKAEESKSSKSFTLIPQTTLKQEATETPMKRPPTFNIRKISTNKTLHQTGTERMRKPELPQTPQFSKKTVGESEELHSPSHPHCSLFVNYMKEKRNDQSSNIAPTIVNINIQNKTNISLNDNNIRRFNSHDSRDVKPIRLVKHCKLANPSQIITSKRKPEDAPYESNPSHSIFRRKKSSKGHLKG